MLLDPDPHHWEKKHWQLYCIWENFLSVPWTDWKLQTQNFALKGQFKNFLLSLEQIAIHIWDSNFVLREYSMKFLVSLKQHINSCMRTAYSKFCLKGICHKFLSVPWRDINSHMRLKNFSVRDTQQISRCPLNRYKFTYRLKCCFKGTHYKFLRTPQTAYFQPVHWDRFPCQAGSTQSSLDPSIVLHVK